MKKLIGIMFYFLILTGCADKAEEVAMIEEVSEPASEGTMQPMLLEYMWCDFGPETTEEAMAALTADFNEIVSSSEYKVSSAWGYIPSFETDLYDAIKRIQKDAEIAVRQGVTQLILTDKELSNSRLPLPMILAVGSINTFLIKKKLRGFGVGIRFTNSKSGGADMCFGLNPYNGTKQFHFIANFKKM